MDRRVGGLRLALVVIGGCVMLLAARPSGVAAEAPTESELLNEIEHGGTAKDHAALAAYYRGQAEAATKQADYHEQTMQKFAPAMGKTDWATHCRSLIEYYRATGALETSRPLWRLRCQRRSVPADFGEARRQR